MRQGGRDGAVACRTRQGNIDKVMHWFLIPTASMIAPLKHGLLHRRRRARRGGGEAAASLVKSSRLGRRVKYTVSLRSTRCRRGNRSDRYNAASPVPTGSGDRS